MDEDVKPHWLNIQPAGDPWHGSLWVGGSGETRAWLSTSGSSVSSGSSQLQLEIDESFGQPRTLFTSLSHGKSPLVD